MERALIRQYEADMAEVLAGVTPETMDAAVALAELPLQIRGFGPVKEAATAQGGQAARGDAGAVPRGRRRAVKQAAE